MISQVFAAMMGTIAFSLLFGVPRKYYIWCGLIGGAGWAVYVLASGYVSGAGASFAATVVVIFLSRAAAVGNRCPATIFSHIRYISPGAGSGNLLDRLLPGDGTAGTGCVYGV